MYFANTEVVGTRETIRFLYGLYGDTENAVLIALQKLGEIAKQRIIDIIAQGTSINPSSPYTYSTGELIDSIKVDLRKFGNAIQIVIYSDVVHAVYIEYGFTMTGPKRVKMPDGKWKTVQTFTFKGLRAFEQGLSSINPIFNIIVGREMKKVGWKDDKSFEYISLEEALNEL